MLGIAGLNTESGLLLSFYVSVGVTAGATKADPPPTVILPYEDCCSCSGFRVECE